MSAPHAHFQLPDGTPRSSKTAINIAGFQVYLYGVDELTPEQAKDTTVLFHVHGRTRTYQDVEPIAHQLLAATKQRGKIQKGLVIATFDNRNHGQRAIDDISIQDWKAGNPKHAQDMLSMIDGITLDVRTVIKFLESYVGGTFVPTQFIMTGLSLGGHVAWNVLAEEPLVKTAVPIIGSPDLTHLLLDRLGGYKSAAEVPPGTKEWPESIARLYQARDESVTKISGKRILILNGALDPLVPSRFTRPWVQEHGDQNDVTFVEQADTGHWLSHQMMDRMVDWLFKDLAPSSQNL